MTEHVPITADANVDLLIKSIQDVREFFNENRVQNSDVWRRYNYNADHSDHARKLPHDKFSTLVEHAAEQGKITGDIFGLKLPEQ